MRTDWMGSMGLVLLACVGCGTSHNVASAIRPEAPSAAQTLDSQASCGTKGAATEPLVVDWKPELRGDLELAMKQGVTVVAYDCHEMRVLRDCHVEGSYGFMGMTPKEQIVRLENADEVRANLPLTGALLIAKIGGELETGTTLDIALVLVGRKRTTWIDVAPTDLRGDCKGATHAVRGAMVGAFAMQTQSKAKASSVVEIFGAGASGQSASGKSVSSRDGQLEDCKSSNADAPAAPGHCGVPVRLELIPIASRDVEAISDTDPAEKSAACPQGMLMRGGKCTAVSDPGCRWGDPAGCDRSCAKGDVESCARVGRMYAVGKGLTRNPGRAAEYLQKACDGGSAYGCWGLGIHYEQDDGPKDYARAFQLLKRACADGHADGCTDLGYGYAHGEWPGGADELKAVAYAEKGCNGGSQLACNNLGSYYDAGRGIAKDKVRALGLYIQACDGGNAVACANAGRALVDGRGAEKDSSRGAALLQKSCNKGHGTGCAELGSCYEKGVGVTKDVGRAVELYKKGCDAKSHFERACYYLGRSYQDGAGVPRDPARALPLLRKACGAKEDRACKELAKAGDKSAP